jgi:acyl carrier protein
MVPAALVEVEAMPLTPNGKLDRSALPAPQWESPRPYEAPQGESEQFLSGLFGDALKVDQVGRHDNFFELGGHSILVMRVLATIQQAYALSIPVKTFFEGATVSEVAHLIDCIRYAGASDDEGAIADEFEL